jgi:DNA-directed RNA polymerase subunit beta
MRCTAPKPRRTPCRPYLEAAKAQPGKDWVYDPENPGKIQLIDGRTANAFDQPVTVGYAHILKLVPPGGRQDPRPLHRPLLRW